MKKILLFVVVIILIVVSFFLFKSIGIKNNEDVITNNVLDNESDIVQNDELYGKYSKEEWEKLALDFYEKENNYRPSSVASELKEENILLIQLYDSFSDHNSTSDYYEVNTKTGIAVNILGKKIDLINGKYVEE